MKKILILLISISVAGLLNAQTWGDYTLYSVQNSTAAYLIDMSNNNFKTWTFTSSAKTGYSTYLTKGDTLVRSYASGSGGGGGMTGGLQKVLWNGTVYWDITYTNMHHDICPMPNGNVLIIVYDSKTSTQALAMGANSSRTIKSEKIVELKRTGTNTYQEVWVWYLWDHLCQEYSSSKPNYYSDVALHPELLDINVNTQSEIMHMNGIDYNEELDQIVFSCHNLNEIFVIDHSTTTAQAATHTGGNSGKGGDFLYRWGSPANYDETGTTNFNVVHDARWVPNDHVTCPGCISAYNNMGGTGSKSASDMIDPPDNGYNYDRTNGEPFGPTTYTHRYTASNSSNNMGGQQRLPNGNVFMCVPASASYLTEVSSSGTALWSKTVSGTVAQAIRYDKCYVRGPIVSAGASATQVCPGSAVTLNSSATSVTETSPVYSYAWSSTNGFTSSVQNPVLNPTASGTYTVTITNTSISCSATATVTVNVYTAPTAFAGNDVSISAGQQATLSATGGTGFQWNTGQNTQSIVVQPSETTTYTVTVSDSHGCTASDEVIVTVTGSVLSVTATANPQTICAGDAVQLNANPSGGSGYSFSWESNPSGFTSAEQNPIVYPQSSVTYSVTVTSGGNNATNSVSVVVNPLPLQPVITQDDQTLVSSAADSYQWYLGANEIAGATGQSYSPQQNGNYVVEITDENGCSNTSEPFPFTGTSIASDEKGTVFMVYPNPANSVVYVQNTGEFLNYSIRLLTVTGTEVYSGTNVDQINLESLSSGLYFMYIYPENGPSQMNRISLNK